MKPLHVYKCVLELPIIEHWVGLGMDTTQRTARDMQVCATSGCPSCENTAFRTQLPYTEESSRMQALKTSEARTKHGLPWAMPNRESYSCLAENGQHYMCNRCWADWTREHDKTVLSSYANGCVQCQAAAPFVPPARGQGEGGGAAHEPAELPIADGTDVMRDVSDSFTAEMQGYQQRLVSATTYRSIRQILFPKDQDRTNVKVSLSKIGPDAEWVDPDFFPLLPGQTWPRGRGPQTDTICRGPLRGLMAKTPFLAGQPIAVLAYTGENYQGKPGFPVRIKQDLYAYYPVDDTDSDHFQNLGYLINSNQGPLNHDGVQTYYETNCMFQDFKCGNEWVVVAVTTQDVQTNEEFLTYYELPLSAPFTCAFHRDYPGRSELSPG